MNGVERMERSAVGKQISGTLVPRRQNPSLDVKGRSTPPAYSGHYQSSI
jgi:hypothetical protein